MKLDSERLNKILGGMPFVLNEGQLNFLYKYISGAGHNLLIGEAGSGKSAILTILKQYYKDEMVFCASTGVANQNLLDGKGGEGTAHRVFSLPLKMGDEIARKKVSRPCSALFSGSDLIKHVVVDEFFMLNPEHLDIILDRVNRFNKRTSKRNQRNIRLLMVGDCLQIPPVISDKDKIYLRKTYGSHLTFESKPWDKLRPEVSVLTEVMRQGDKTFKACLEVLRYGQEHRYEGVLQWLNKRVNYNYDRNLFTIATYNKTVESVNLRVLNSNPNPKIEFKARIKGKFSLKDNNVEESITLSEGLECITTSNHKDGDFSNGSFCIIKQVSTEGCYCYFPHNDSELFVELKEYEQTESYVMKDVAQQDGSVKDVLKKDIIGTCEQIPLMQASAFSCHRSQGRTFDKEGVLDMGFGFREDNDFGQSLLYTGVSRFTDVNLIHLPRPLKKEHIKVCRRSVEFYKKCLQQSLDNKTSIS